MSQLKVNQKERKTALCQKVISVLTSGLWGWLRWLGNVPKFSLKDKIYTVLKLKAERKYRFSPDGRNFYTAPFGRRNDILFIVRACLSQTDVEGLCFPLLPNKLLDHSHLRVPRKLNFGMQNPTRWFMQKNRFSFRPSSTWIQYWSNGTLKTTYWPKNLVTWVMFTIFFYLSMAKFPSWG